MGLISALRQLLSGAAGIAATRLELVLLEIEQERLQLARLWIRAALTLFLLFTGTVLCVGGLLLWAAPEQRAAVAGALALGFLVAALVAGFSWLRLARARARQRLMAGLLKDLQGLERGLRGGADSR
ncbi:MAG: hypothetical protein WCI59_03205 [Betaproteobacteria bacterium]